MSFDRNGNGPNSLTEEEVEQIEADAIRSVREPLENLEEAVIWLCAANDAVKAQTIYSVWSELNREKEELLAALVTQEIERANQELLAQGVE